MHARAALRTRSGRGATRLTNIENLTGSALSDTLTGDANANALSGLAGSDALNGGAGNDTLTGLTGNNTLNGGPGNNSMDGGAAGSDTASYADAAGAVTVSLAHQGTAQNTIGAGVDTLRQFRESDRLGLQRHSDRRRQGEYPERPRRKSTR